MEREAPVRPLNLDTILIVRTDRELHAALHGAARREGTTASALVRKAVAAIVAPDVPPAAVTATVLRAAA
jgi:hypothetical protein